MGLIIIALLLSFSSMNCNTTAVKLAQIPTTGGSISEPGNYYLGFDVPDGGVTINADRVTLNLNGHTVRNILISGHQDITLTNGTVEASSLASGSAICISGSDNVHLSNLTVRNAGASVTGYTNGIGILEKSTDIFLSQILMENNTSAGCRIQGSAISSDAGGTGVFISDCVFHQNGTASNATAGSDLGRVGLLISKSNTEVLVRRCLANANKQHGFFVRVNCEMIYFFDCIASENGVSGGDGNGFYGSQGSSPPIGPVTYVALKCISESNKSHGFAADSGVSFIFENCVTVNNQKNGFDTRGDTLGLVKECTALRNLACGFNNDGSSSDSNQPVTYVANYAAQNRIPYCLKGKVHTKFPYCTRLATDTEANFWRNIQI